MRRTYLFCALIALCPLLGLMAFRSTPARADKTTTESNGNGNGAAAKKMPLTQVVLFNTGLGYFQREGQVEGDTRIELAIPTNDVNDLLKTLLIDNAGKPTAVSYDGSEPIDSKLRSFGMDLTINPTLGQLLNQARGEKVEISVEGTGSGAATSMNGVIVGMEAEATDGIRETHHLNLLCSDGVRRVPLLRVQRVRFLDPVLEDEFRRALSVLSAGRSDVRRLVSVRLHGEGKRKVKLAHVAETPIWKASYRLVLDGKDTKPSMQGYAIVENTTDEDWKDVRVILVSGRPITFRMDLAQQLFMPRPTVTPEVFASLAPPTFAPATPVNRLRPQASGLLDDTGAQGVQLGGIQLGGVQLGVQIGMSAQGQTPGAANLGAGGGAFGLAGGIAGPGGPFNRYQFIPTTIGSSRLSYEELQQRRNELLAERKQATRQARDLGSTLAALGADIDDIVTNADRIGEGFRLGVEPRVNLARQKSAMLTMVQGAIDMKRISVYTPTVHPRFPLLAVRVKNSTGQHLQQGPAAVYDEGVYVGDCRLPDMQPNQERLLSYAMDLGVEIRPEQTEGKDIITSVKIEQGELVIDFIRHRKTTYQILNRSKLERTVLVEHPMLAEWNLTKDSSQPVEKSRQQYRFEWKVDQGKTERKEVKETHATSRSEQLSGTTVPRLREWLKLETASAAVKNALNRILIEAIKLQPNQERLLSYATDLGVEIRPEQTEGKDIITSVKIEKGTLVTDFIRHRKTTYQILNRSKLERTVLVEHPVSAEWNLTKDSAQPMEKSRQQYRFEWKVDHGKTERKEVAEMHGHSVSERLNDSTVRRLKELLEQEKASAAVKDTLKLILAGVIKKDSLTEDVRKLDEQVSEAWVDWQWAAAKLGKLSADTPAHKKQQKELEDIDALLKKLRAQRKLKAEAVHIAKEAHEAAVKSLNAK